MSVLWFAGGCFWGTEHAFSLLDGVVGTQVGYANGRFENPTYEQVKRSDTGFRETVRVEFDSRRISVDTLLKAFFLCIDPEQEDGQAHDIGDQYRTGIYYDKALIDEADLKEIEAFYYSEKGKYERFYTEFKPLECFYPAEEYHQKYLVKNPSGYCHISLKQFAAVKALNDPEE